MSNGDGKSGCRPATSHEQVIQTRTATAQPRLSADILDDIRRIEFFQSLGKAAEEENSEVW